MRLDDFRALARRLADEVPEEFLDGIVEITVSPRSVPHPIRADIYTLGECVPLPSTPGAEVQSRIVLYHGSFAALARLDSAFDWVAEARETLQHELRHHVEWRAGASDLEALDWAAEQNYARHEGESFDPLFFLDGEKWAPGVYQVEDDWFLDHLVRRQVSTIQFTWHGREYSVAVPEGFTPPSYLTVNGVAEPPPGDLVVVVRKRPNWLELVWPRPLGEAVVDAVPVTPTPLGGSTG